uniref:Uncharacterized protein n=1 Tax=Cyclophora tenuis TaxID=216820 RepID=A0A7S1CXZ8_CYCTE|mmetsp:Transcript_14007/g.23763  ORF Transcript_14007/g.23763 Transcript_14007/m.23763 type:complete len:127 (-) Transcript_14007:75-455(-)
MARRAQSIVSQRLVLSTSSSTQATSRPTTPSIAISKHMRDVRWREFSVSSSMQDQYDLSTWQMYHRIVSSRMSKRSCGSLSDDSISLQSDDRRRATMDERNLSADMDASLDDAEKSQDEMMFSLDL